MTLHYIRKGYHPTYIALKSDIIGNGTIPGAGILGGTIWFTDTSEWGIVTEGGIILPYAQPPLDVGPILYSLSPSVSPSVSPSISSSLSSSLSPSKSPSISPSVSPSV